MADSTQPSVPNTKNRPLSPHLQIYKWQITMTLSILHRATGVGLCAGLVLLTAWIWSAAYCPETFTWLQEHRADWWFRLVITGFTAAMFFHLLNGIRHLGWDTGSGMTNDAVTRSGWIVVVGTAVLTWLVSCPLYCTVKTDEAASVAPATSIEVTTEEPAITGETPEAPADVKGE